MDGNALLPPPAVKVPSAEQEAEKKRLNEEVTVAGARVEKGVADVNYVDPIGENALPEFKKEDRVWFDDALPEGAKPAGGPAGEVDDPWHFVTAPDHPVFSGKNSSKRTGEGITPQYGLPSPYRGSSRVIALKERPRRASGQDSCYGRLREYRLRGAESGRRPRRHTHRL